MVDGFFTSRFPAALRQTRGMALQRTIHLWARHPPGVDWECGLRFFFLFVAGYVGQHSPTVDAMTHILDRVIKICHLQMSVQTVKFKVTFLNAVLERIFSETVHYCIIQQLMICNQRMEKDSYFIYCTKGKPRVGALVVQQSSHNVAISFYL